MKGLWVAACLALVSSGGKGVAHKVEAVTGALSYPPAGEPPDERIPNQNRTTDGTEQPVDVLGGWLPRDCSGVTTITGNVEDYVPVGCTYDLFVQYIADTRSSLEATSAESAEFGRICAEIEAKRQLNSGK